MDSRDRIVVINNKAYHLRKREDGRGMVLVREYPDDVLHMDREVEQQRLAAVTDYGAYRASPRTERPANITQAVDTRTQTVLSHEMDSANRSRINCQIEPSDNKGRR
ncbi:MAG: hypothetical protein ACPG4N_02765 [Gammaproteobacteria bacterium]